MTKILASAQENSLNYAIRELKEIFAVKDVKKLGGSIVLAEITENAEHVLSTILNNKPIFIRYLVPVLFEDVVKKGKNNFNFIEDFKLNKSDNYVLHLTIINNDFFDKQEILNYLKENNIIISPKKANKIINITIDNQKLYLGVIDIKDSLSSWNFGECRFKNEDEQISRAEFKLLEAIEYFNIDLKDYKNALDLGAAPGGWSRILLNKGLNVIAIDPAELDQRIVNNVNLKHYKGTSQNFFKENKDKKYDLIVNDMKMDTKNSIQIIKEASKYLAEDGLIIMTLKLSPSRECDEVKQSIKLIKNDYKIIGVHQLFHNRSEATIVFENLQ